MEISATWTLEILAAIVSSLALGAMSGTLYYAHNKVVHDWNGITLNTVISILSTTTRVCAIFVVGAAIAQSKWVLFSKSPHSLLEFEDVEQAGRGVSGAVKLLVKVRKVAAIGALAIILSLAFDPFTQQLVQYRHETRWRPDLAASLPRAKRYSAGNRVPVQMISNITRGSNSTAVYDNSEFSMQASVFYGLISPVKKVNQQLSLGCPTGNCTWPPSETLAVCSVCNNLDTSIQKSMIPATGPLSTLLVLSNPSSMVGNLTRYTLPNGAYIDNVDGMKPITLMTYWGTGDASTSTSLTAIDTMIWSATMMIVQGDPAKEWPAQGVQATECGLYYCVKQYETYVTNSTTSQSYVVNTAAVRSPDSWQPIETFNARLNATENATLVFDKSQSLVKRTDLMLGDNYNISQAAVDGISNFFMQNFAYADGVEHVNGFYLSEASGATQYQPASIKPLYDSVDLNATFTAIAESMSNVIRANSDKRLRSLGMSGIGVTFYHISWPWIALPAVFVLCALAQLAVSVWTSRKVPLWKSSTLATMSRGRWLGDVLDKAATVQEMHNIAAKQPVHLFSHTAPGGVAAVANSNVFHEKLDGTTVTVREIGEELDDLSSASEPTRQVQAPRAPHTPGQPV